MTEEPPWGNQDVYVLLKRIELLENDMARVLPWAYKSVEENRGNSLEAKQIYQDFEEGMFGFVEIKDAKEEKIKIDAKIGKRTTESKSHKKKEKQSKKSRKNK